MFGYDAISANIGAIPAGATTVFGYVSGSPYIQWTQAMFNRFPHASHEYIDQGRGIPWRAPTVIDVENGAHSPSDVPRLAKLYPGVKVYCNQSTLAAVYATGWRGKVWVAAPGSDHNVITENVERVFRGFTVWGVQDIWTKTYDRTTINAVPVIPPPPPPTINIEGYKVPRPSLNNVPVVISWWGTAGIVHRRTNLTAEQWTKIVWLK